MNTMADGMETIYDEADWLVNAAGAVLNSEARNKLPDSSFCYVKEEDGKRVRKFPSHDAAHVRNALARLSQADVPSGAKASILGCLRRKAKKFGITVSEAKGAKGAEVLINSEVIKEDVPHGDGLFWTIGTKIGGAAYADTGDIVTFSDSLASQHSSWLGKDVFINHDQSTSYGKIKELIYAEPYLYFGLDLNDEAKAKAVEAKGSSIDIENLVVNDNNSILSFEGKGISLVLEPMAPACNVADGMCDCGKNIGFAGAAHKPASAEAAHKHAKAVAKWVVHLEDMRESLVKEADKIGLDSETVAHVYRSLAGTADSYISAFKTALGEAYLIEAKGSVVKIMCNTEECKKKHEAFAAELEAGKVKVAELEGAVAIKAKALDEATKALEVFKAKEAEAVKAERVKLDEELKGLGRDPSKFGSLDNTAFAGVLSELKEAVAAAKDAKPKSGQAAGAGLPEAPKEATYDDYKLWYKKNYGRMPWE